MGLTPYRGVRHARWESAGLPDATSVLKSIPMENEDILRSRGFVLIHRRMLWISHDLRMAFSHEAVRDRDSHWLGRALSERVAPTDFVFHFNQVPEDIQLCREILREIGLPNLVPYMRVATIRAAAT